MTRYDILRLRWVLLDATPSPQDRKDIDHLVELALLGVAVRDPLQDMAGAMSIAFYLQNVVMPTSGHGTFSGTVAAAVRRGLNEYLPDRRDGS